MDGSDRGGWTRPAIQVRLRPRGTFADPVGKAGPHQDRRGRRGCDDRRADVVWYGSARLRRELIEEGFPVVEGHGAEVAIEGEPLRPERCPECDQSILDQEDLGLLFDQIPDVTTKA